MDFDDSFFEDDEDDIKKKEDRRKKANEKITYYPKICEPEVSRYTNKYSVKYRVLVVVCYSIGYS